MKRWQQVLLGVFALAVVVGGGYLGFKGGLPSFQQETPSIVEAPPTVEVSKGEVKQTIISPGTLVNYKTVEIPAGTSGTVEEVNVQPGDQVNEGAVLVKIDGSEQAKMDIVTAELNLLDSQTDLDNIFSNAELMQAEALKSISEAEQELSSLDSKHALKLAEALKSVTDARKEAASAEYKLNSLGAPASESTLAAAQADLALAEERLKNAEQAYAPYRNKPDGDVNKAYTQSEWAAAKQAFDTAVSRLNYLTGSPSSLSIAEAEAKLALANAYLAQAEEIFAELTEGLDPADKAIAEANLNLAIDAYERLTNGIDLDELARAEANLEKTKLELSIAQEKLEHLEITAPFDGVILSVSVKEGQSINEGMALIKFADPHALEVSTSIVEEDYPLLKVGQEVNLYFDAAPEESTKGQVDRIIPLRASGDRPLYQVFISIDDVPDVVVEGMTADTEIILEIHSDVLRLPRALVKAKSNGEVTLYIWAGDHEEERQVTVGLRGDMFVEIVSGLEKGEMVIAK